jgi:hypothetical protein
MQQYGWEETKLIKATAKKMMTMMEMMIEVMTMGLVEIVIMMVETVATTIVEDDNGDMMTVVMMMEM